MSQAREQILAETAAAEAFWTLDPLAAVSPGEPWHVDLDARLDRSRYGVGGKLLKLLTSERGSPRYVHLGIVGAGGTGKSTQARDVMQALKPHGIDAVFVDALAYFDQTDLSFADVVLVLTENVVRTLAEARVEIPEAERELVKLWFAEELLTESHRNQILGSLEVEARASAGVPLLARLAAKLTGVLTTDNEYRQEIRRRAERDPVDLVRRANLLLDAATAALGQGRPGPRTLAVVFDNLEKLGDRRQVDAAVLRRADDLKRLRCHLVLFLHTADEWAPTTVRASEVFHIVSVPMLPVRAREDPPDAVDPVTLAAVRALFDRRMDLDGVVEHPDDFLTEATRLSGGRLRDLLRLGREACGDAGPGRVTQEHLRRAARRMAAEMAVLVAPDEWRRLAEIHGQKRPSRTPTDGYLHLHSLVLNYDGDPWWDVHPLVCEDERFADAWQRLTRIVPGP